MAHELDFKENGEARFFSAETKGWHNLGRLSPQLLTTKQAIIESGLDQKVYLRPMTTTLETVTIDANGNLSTGVKSIPIDDFFCTVREDGRVLGAGMSADYQVVQSEDAFGFFDEVIGPGAACLTSAGAIFKGTRIFISAKLPNVTEVRPGDSVENYLILTTSHDASSSIKVLISAIRPVCWNTLSAAIKGCSNIISVKHTKNYKKGLSAAKNLLNQNNKYWEQVSLAYGVMAKKELNTTTVKEALAKIFPGNFKLDELTGEQQETVSTRTQNIRDHVESLFAGEAIGSNLAGKTAWGLYNAVTEYLGKHRATREETDMWEADVFGSAVSTRQEAFDILVAV